jgi:hypothetical protein
MEEETNKTLEVFKETDRVVPESKESDKIHK